MVFSLPSGTTISNTKHHRGRHVTKKSVIQSNNSHQQRSAELNCWSCSWPSTPSPRNQQDRHSHMVFSLPSSTAILNRLQPKTTTHTNIFSVNGMSVETVGQEYKDCVLYGSTNSKCYFTWVHTRFNEAIRRVDMKVLQCQPSEPWKWHFNKSANIRLKINQPCTWYSTYPCAPKVWHW